MNNIQKDYKRRLVTAAVGKVVREKRAELGKDINHYLRFGLSEVYINNIENEIIELDISAVWKFAFAFGMKCSDFVKLIEKELAKDLDFYKG